MSPGDLRAVDMTISVTCPCGKHLKAPQSLRGKMARCPGCGKPLRVVEAPAATAAPPPAAPTATAPPAVTAPPPVPVAGVDGYELSEADLKVTIPGDEDESDDSDDAPDESGRKCPNCRAVMKTGEVICGQCGFSPKAGVYTGQQRTQDQTKVYGSVLGMDVTLGRGIVLALTVVLLASLLSWWLIWGPGRNFRVIETQVVAGFDALDTVGVLQPASLGQLGGNANLGMKAIAGIKAPPGVKVVENDIFGLGGLGKLVLTRPDASGTYLLIRVELNQGFLQEAGYSAHYDVVFRDTAYELQTPSGPVTATLLAVALPSGVNLETAEGTTCDYKALFPSTCKPSGENLKRYDNYPVSGTVTFTDPNAHGSFEFEAPKIRNPYGASLVAMGKLEVKTPQGMGVTYNYLGGGMTVQWAPGVTGWRGCPMYMHKEEFWPYHKWEVLLLFPKPKDQGYYDLLFNKKTMTRVWVPATATIGTSSFVALPPPPPPAAPGGGTSGGTTPGSGTSGGPAPASSGASAPPATAANLGSDPLSQYLNALLRARQQARNVVSLSNMHEVLQVVFMYAQEHGGRMPDRLEDLRGSVDNFDALMRNPKTTEVPGFVYLKPADTYEAVKNPSQTPILYEAKQGQPDPKGDIGYADGHVTSGK